MALETNNNIIEDTEEFRDHIATVDQEGKRIWLYPKKPSGRFYNARTIVSFIFLLLFFTVPFIKVDGEQFLLLNVLQRKFVLFGILFTPQDFHIFVFAMLTFIVFIILFTVVFGRLFCGWVCPQTVFMEMVFRKIEYWIEGDANEQRRMDKGPWNSEKVQKRGLKHLVFFGVAFIVANYFLAYIIGMDEVLRIVREPVSQHVGGFTALIIFSFAFYFVYIRLREQVCTTICPYGRLQGVLLVKDSIVVAYDHVRGEPRGKLKKQSAAATATDPNNPVTKIQNMVAGDAATARRTGPSGEPLGDCIDCKLCIAVCPTGIDIRHGTQLECTNCTACIDACDVIMDRIERPRGLIRYDSMTGIESGKRKIFTTRVWAYTAVLTILLVATLAMFVNRGIIETIILRSPGQLYQQKDDTHLSNLYTFVVINKSVKPMPIRFQTVTQGAELQLVGQPPADIQKGGKAEGAFFITMPAEKLTGRKTELTIDVYSGDQKIDEIKTNFMGPGGSLPHMEKPEEKHDAEEHKSEEQHH